MKRRLRQRLLRPELRNPERLKRTLTSYRGLLRSP